MPDLTPAYKGVDPESVVRALKGDRLTPLQPLPPEADYGIGNEFYHYAPGSPNDVNMDKTGTVKPNSRSYPEMGFPAVPPHDWMHDRVGGMFGVPAQHLQQMAGDVVPFPRQPGPVLSPDEYQRALEKMKGVDTRKLLDDVLGAPSNVTPFPSPPSPSPIG